MKFNTFGSWDWRSIVSLGISLYIGERYFVLTIMVGPFTRSVEVYFG
jgi:hypothetical protein